MEKLTTIDITKESLHFSAAHFTIFSATERERLHGHNFFVSAAVTAVVQPDGMCFNYSQLKDSLRELSVGLDEYLLLAGDSPYQQIDEDGGNYKVTFADEEMTFLKADTLVLPVTNITIEELSHYLLNQLLEDSRYSENKDIKEITLRVASGPGQWGAAVWRNPLATSGA
ncbi:6-pyruvoyl trahydropterin synthase family protein [Pseudomaricurvus sp.]|uniref:6-pyruvoyl trahydropterin synthase family protein n=1 Tax=Pseudomaricurvus sp. TaxID=2004510 RepID=UPI003F6D3029